MQIYEIEGACVDVRFIVVGLLKNNVYLIDDGASAIVVDPSARPDSIMELLGERELSAIFITHHHFDHTGAAAELRARTGAPVIASALDAPGIEEPKKEEGSSLPVSDACSVDRIVEDGDIVEVGAMRWKALITPGHTQGSMCFLLEEPEGSKGASVLVSGDTLFQGTTGRTDFEGGSDSDMRASIERLAKLPDEVLVLPGHAGITTIGDERSGAFLRWGVR